MPFQKHKVIMLHITILIICEFHFGYMPLVTSIGVMTLTIKLK